MEKFRQPTPKKDYSTTSTKIQALQNMNKRLEQHIAEMRNVLDKCSDI